MATQELNDYDPVLHEKLVDYFKRKIVNGEVFIVNNNDMNDCSNDCQRAMHKLTNIASQFDQIDIDIEEKASGLECRNDVYQIQKNDGTMISVAYGELLCVADGPGKGAVSNQMHGYYWRDGFQQNKQARPPQCHYDPERNVQSFAIMLSDPRWNDLDVRIYDFDYKISRNSRMNYCGFLQMAPSRVIDSHTPFGKCGHMLLLFNVYNYPILYNPQSGEAYCKLQQFMQDTNLSHQVESVHLYALHNNVYLKLKIMNPRAFNVRSGNQIILFNIYLKYHQNILLKTFLEADFGKHFTIYYACVWGITKREMTAEKLNEIFNIDITTQELNEWIEMGSGINYEDPKIFKLRETLDIVYDIIEELENGIQSLTNKEISMQINFICSHIRAAMHLDPVNLDTSTYMISASDYTNEHTAIRQEFLQVVLQSDDTIQFKNEIRYIKQLNDNIAYIFNKKLCDIAADYLVEHYFVVTLPYTGVKKLVTRVKQCDPTMYCELNSKFAAASGWFGIEMNNINGYFLGTKSDNNAIGTGVAPYEDKDVYLHFSAPEKITNRLQMMYSVSRHFSPQQLLNNHLNLGSGPTVSIIRILKNEPEPSPSAEPPIDAAIIISGCSKNSIDKDEQYLNRFSNEVDINIINSQLYNAGVIGGAIVAAIDGGNQNDNANANNGNDNNNNDDSDSSSDDSSSSEDNSIVKSVLKYNKSIMRDIDDIKTNQYYDLFTELGDIYRRCVREQGVQPEELWKGKYDKIVLDCIEKHNIEQLLQNIDSKLLIGKYKLNETKKQQCKTVLDAIKLCCNVSQVCIQVRKINCLITAVQLRASGHVPNTNSKVAELTTKASEKNTLRGIIRFVDWLTSEDVDCPAIFFVKNKFTYMVIQKMGLLTKFVEFIGENQDSIDSIGTNECSEIFEEMSNDIKNKWALFNSINNTFNQ